MKVQQPKFKIGDTLIILQDDKIPMPERALVVKAIQIRINETFGGALLTDIFYEFHNSVWCYKEQELRPFK